jgi:hypothetical protein
MGNLSGGEIAILVVQACHIIGNILIYVDHRKCKSKCCWGLVDVEDDVQMKDKDKAPLPIDTGTVIPNK